MVSLATQKLSSAERILYLLLVRLFKINERYKTAMATVAFTELDAAFSAIDELDDTVSGIIPPS